MRLWILFSLLLMMVASSPSVDCKRSYNRIRKVLQELKTHGETRKSISFEKRGPPAPLCGACPAVALPTNVSCATTWAPEFEPTEVGDCVCLKSYTCCPQNCPNISMDVCSENTTGNFFVEIGSDCCDCPTSTCVRCPSPVTPKDLICDPCYHYERHLTQHNESHCWESGCQKNAKIIYPEPGCDINCQTISSVKDDCGNTKKICVDNSTPIGCQPAKPAKKQCFVSPKKVFINKYFSSEGVCKKCWKWEITRKLEQCSQIFPLGESCPSAHKMITGVTTCGTQRDICLPIKATKPKCTACEEIKTVKDDYGFPVHTCIMKWCPSLSNLAGKECGPLKFVKDSCGCESIKCGTTDEVDGQEWTRIQRRLSISKSPFGDATWSEYKNGFGNPNGDNFWLGLEKLHQMTSEGRWQLMMKMKLSSGPNIGAYGFAIWEGFRIGPESQGYKLTVGARTKISNMISSSDSFQAHNGKQFSAKDRGPLSSNAKTYVGGWWFVPGFNVCLNCYYGTDGQQLFCCPWQSASETIIGIRKYS